MKETEQGEIPYFELDPSDNVIAYCETCKKPVFVGNDKTRVGRIILRGQVLGHKDFFEEEHSIAIVYPRSEGRRILDSKTLENKIYFTVRTPKNS